jgi:uncharacterized repeat protein (TIGR03803 family)
MFAAADVLLHTFAGGPADGELPQSQLALAGSVLYGTTSEGGANDLGTLFSLNTDGSGYTVLHEFAGGAGDGSQPQFGALIVDGTMLYGTTFAGGSSDLGVVFSYDTSLPPATAFSVLHSFAGGLLDGASPRGGLMLDGTTLYGVTTAGGLLGQGTLFQIDTSGAGFQLLAIFGGIAGSAPIAAPTLLNGHLYGTATAGGASGVGTIYDYDVSGGTLGVLHDFANVADNGASPEHGKLAVIGDTLYGATSAGGAQLLGTLYGYDTTAPAASAFSLLHSFAGGPADGSHPLGSLAVADELLLGATAQGGASGNGTLFTFDPGSSIYLLRYSFAGSPTDGSTPVEGPVVTSQPGRATLFGTTSTGGAPTGSGTVYSLQIPVANPNAISVTAADWQGRPQVTVYNADGTERFSFRPYNKKFLGGVRVATGDVNGDGIPDIVTAPGPGPRKKVRIFSGVDGSSIAAFNAGSKSFSGGYHVAVGNFDADASQEVVVAFGSGGTSAVQTFNIDAGAVTVFPGALGLFYPYGSSFKGGVQLAAANLDGVGFDELITAPGYGGNSQVQIYSASGALLNSFVAYDTPFTGGLFIAAGDVNGDLLPELITGPAQTNQALVRVFDGQAFTQLAESYVYGENFRGGVRVAVADRNQDGIGEVMTAPGILGNQNIRFLDGATLATIDQFFENYPGPRKVRGVFVAGSRL